MAERIGYPVLVRPSYVLGGRAMAIVYDASRLEEYVREAVKASPEHPILIDRFLEDAFEVDVDALGDGERVVIGGILQHIEEAGIHSGDSAMVLPTYKIAAAAPRDDPRATRGELGLALGVRGPDERPVRDQERRGLRARGEPARLAHDALREQGDRRAAGEGGGADHGRPERSPSRGSPRTSTVDRIFVKESVFPFLKFPGADILLGPEMKSTGEVMGISNDFGHRLRQVAAGRRLPHPDRGHRLHLASTTSTRPGCCRTRGRSTRWASTSWPPAARPST